MKRLSIILTLALALLAGAAAAENIDLVTLPGRDTVQLTIYNSEDITLVKETRHLSMKKGMNRIQFSWANTLIDPSSVEFRPLEHADDIEVADTVFPGLKPQHLVWNIESRFEGQVKVEVTYFTSGLTWSMDYVAITDPEEEAMDFRGHVREKIADLARRRGIPVPQLGTPAAKGMALEVSGAAFSRAEKSRDMRAGKKQIVKEGLSEYFMFSVAGTETISNGWSKRMQAVESDHARFDILYRMRAHQYGPRPVRFFLWKNDAEHKLGDSPLPDGLVRVFRRNGRDGLSFLGEQLIRYVPIKAEIEVNLGVDDLVVYETRKHETVRTNFQFDHGRVVGWNEETRWVDVVRNYREKPIRFELHRQWTGHVDYDPEVETSLFDYRTIEVAFGVGARSRSSYPYAVLTRFGRNASQSRIHLR